MISDLERAARAFATTLHYGQMRKFTGESYIVHPAAVVAILRQVTGDPEILAAGWLHDVVEDCGVTHLEILGRFGGRVGYMVRAVTKARGPNRTLLRLQAASGPAQSIKLADIIDNCRSIRSRNPAGAEAYLAAKRAQLEVLTQGHAALRQVAAEICK